MGFVLLLPHFLAGAGYGLLSGLTGDLACGCLLAVLLAAYNFLDGYILKLRGAFTQSPDEEAQQPARIPESRPTIPEAGIAAARSAVERVAHRLTRRTPNKMSES